MSSFALRLRNLERAFQRAGGTTGSKKPSAVDRIKSILTYLPGLTIIAAVAIALGHTVPEIWRPRRILVETFIVPEGLIKRGHTGESFARAIHGQLAGMTRQALSDRPPTQVELGEKRFEIVLPGAPVTFGTVLYGFRWVLGTLPLTISGQIVDIGSAGTERYRLVVWSGVRSDGAPLVTEGDVDELATKGARELLQEIDPYVAAAYFSFKSEREPDAALTLIYRMQSAALAARHDATKLPPSEKPSQSVAMQPPTELHWVYLLWGYVLKDNSYGLLQQAQLLDERGEATEAQARRRQAKLLLDEALQKFEQANAELKPTENARERLLAIDAIALTVGPQGLGGLATASEKPSFAKQARERLTPMLPHADRIGYSSAYHTIGLIALDLETDLCAAVEAFRQATELDPRNATAWEGWGTALLQQVGRIRYEQAKGAEACLGSDLRTLEREAQAKFERALGADPTYVPALVQWGTMLFQRCQMGSAATRFLQAQILDRGNQEARRKLAQIGTRQDPDPMLIDGCEKAGRPAAKQPG